MNSDNSSRYELKDIESSGTEFTESVNLKILEQKLREKERKQTHGKLSVISEINFPRRRVSPETILPSAYKTLSHRIDEGKSIQANSCKERREETKETPFSLDTWNIESAAYVINFFRSDGNRGLSESHVKENMKIYGSNTQPKPPSQLFRKLFTYFFGGFGPLLFLCGILCIISWKPLGNPPSVANLCLGVVLFLVFIAQAGFNFWQDYSSSRVMKSIHDMIPDDSIVIRDGETISVPTRNIVPGDLIKFTSGTKVPADARIISAESNLSFDKSMLTGESKPIQATYHPDPPFSNYLESKCIAMQGTFCSSGIGLGVVVSTADATAFGKVAKMSATPKRGLTPLQKEVLRFVLITVSIIISLVILLCIIWGTFLKKHYPDWIDTSSLIVDLVSVAVAFVPEGLPIALASCLNITANKLGKCNVLCKSLSVVETLGSMSILCSDKTGTLTKNLMTVIDAFDISNGYQKIPLFSNDKMRNLTLISALCNSAKVSLDTRDKEPESWVIIGNATDAALLKSVGKKVLLNKLSEYWEEVVEVPFSSKNKFMAKLHRVKITPSDNSLSFSGKGYTRKEGLVTVKGAPDILLSRCVNYVSSSGDSITLDGKQREEIRKLQNEWSGEGKRVILLASKRINLNGDMDATMSQEENLEKLCESSLDFQGIVALSDPLKESIPDTISTLKSAGIRVVMVTGDFELTGLAISKNAGIVTHRIVKSADDLDPNFPIRYDKKNEKDCLLSVIDEAILITGSNIKSMTTNEWEHLTMFKEIVFSRTTPDQKLKIVQEFQSRGHVVGMTGDGVNDAPSLKNADIGIAMGHGSDIAKEASDLVLLESFSSIVDALLYGRLVFENLKKTIAYLLPAGTYAELWPVLLNVIFGLPQALSSFCMIIICCLTDCAGAITLAYEAPENNLLLKKPRKLTKEKLVNYKLFLHSYFIIGTFYTLTSMMMCFVCFQRMGIPFSVLTLSYGRYSPEIRKKIGKVSDVSSSVYFVNLVIMQFFNLMAVRTRHLSVLQHPPLLKKGTKNFRAFFAMGFALSVTFFFNYISWFNKNLGTERIRVEYYFIAVGFGSLVLVYDEVRKLLVRKYPESLFARIAW